MLGPLYTLKWFLHVKALQKKLRTKQDVIAWQNKQLAHYFKHQLPKIAAYKNVQVNELLDLPIIDKTTVLDNFADYNCDNISLETVRQAVDQQGLVNKLHAGSSTGTSGNRGYFLITNAECYRWLGVILAKTLPNILTKKRRVALVLPSYTQLYDTAANIGRINVQCFDLSQGIDKLIPKLSSFMPTTLVAPPRVLRALAEAETNIAPKEIFSAAEVLDPKDRTIIEARFSLILREIYMATEGLLGVSCSHGTMHLAEDILQFEYAAPFGSQGLSNLIHTDFTRTFQLMPRYKMNDLVERANTPCPCGSPLQAITHIHGRVDDVFVFKANKKTILVTPDILRNAVVKTDFSITDFRIYQTGENAVTLILPATLSKTIAVQALQNLERTFMLLGARPQLSLKQKPLCFDPKKKLRRVIKACHD